MIELAHEQYPTIWTLFAHYPYIHGLVQGILSGTFGHAFADNPAAPKTGMLIDGDFVFFAGDSTTAAATSMVSRCPNDSLLIGPNDDWEALIRQVWNDQLKLRQRVAFQQPKQWDRERLRTLVQTIPPGYRLTQITTADVQRFAQLSASLVQIDAPAGQPSFANSVGFGIDYDRQYVSGCAGLPAGGMLEFEVQTHPAHKRHGLASAVAAALLEYCLDHDLEPCWDAANPMSTGLALKLGFIETKHYNAYHVTHTYP